MKHLSSSVANFHFENAQSIVYNNELLQGTVRGKAYRTLRVKNVKVTLTCEFSHTDPNDREGSEVMVLHTATENVWEGKHLSAGEYLFPFSFNISADLPPSLETALRDKHVRWRLTATCEHEEEDSVALCSGIFNKGERRFLPAVASPAVAGKDVPFTFVASKDKRMYLFVQLEKDVFVRDEPVKVRVILHNKDAGGDAGRRVSSILVTVVQTEVIAAPGEPHTSKKHVLDEAQADVDEAQGKAAEIQDTFVMMPCVPSDTGAVCAFGPGTFPDLMSTDQHLLNRHTRRLAPSVMYHDLRGGERGGVMILVSYAAHVTAQMHGTEETLSVTLPITIVDAVVPQPLGSSPQPPRSPATHAD